MPAALDVDWMPIRDAAIAGVPLQELADRFGIGFEVIRKRAFRQNWPLPCRVRAKANENGVPSVSQRALKQAETATETIAATLNANTEQGGLIASNLILSLLKNASPEKIQPLQYVQDVAVAVKTLRLASGADKQNTEVKVNLAMFSGSSETQEQGWSADDNFQNENAVEQG